MSINCAKYYLHASSPGAALSGINGGGANEAKGNSFLNGYLGGATGGAIQSACRIYE